MIGAVIRKELATLWVTPVPYVAGALFHAALGLLAVDSFQARSQAVFQPVVPIAAFLLLIVVPILTMRLIADERRSGTLDVLLAIPVRPLPLMAGKWLAAFASVLVVLAPVMVHVVLLMWWGEPDAGPIVAGLIGLVLLSAATVAVGMVASSLTSSQPVAALSASFVLMAAWFVRPSTDSIALRTVTARLSLNERIRTFAAGGIDLGDTSFLVAVTAVALLAASASVFARRSGRPRSRRLAAMTAAAVLLMVVQWNVDEQRRVVDLTAERSLSLTEETLDIVRQIDQPVTITAFLRPDEPGRDQARSVLDRYEDANRRIQADVVDPDAAPGQLRRLGVDPVFGGVALEQGSEVEVVPAAIEQDLTLGLARLLRGELPRVCVTVATASSTSTRPSPTALPRPSAASPTTATTSSRSTSWRETRWTGAARWWCWRRRRHWAPTPWRPSRPIWTLTVGWRCSPSRVSRRAWSHWRNAPVSSCWAASWPRATRARSSLTIPPPRWYAGTPRPAR